MKEPGTIRYELWLTNNQIYLINLLAKSFGISNRDVMVRAINSYLKKESATVLHQVRKEENKHSVKSNKTTPQAAVFFRKSG